MQSAWYWPSPIFGQDRDVVAAGLGGKPAVEKGDVVADRQGRVERAFQRVGERRHDRIADGLDDGALVLAQPPASTPRNARVQSSS